MQPADMTTEVVLPLAVTTFTGLIAGGMLCITVVEAPGRATLPAPAQLQQWRSTFPRAKSLFKTAGIALVPSLCTAAYASQHRLLYAAAAPFAMIAPFTAAFMNSTNERLLTISDADVEKDDGKEVLSLVSTWASLHSVRSALAFTGFAICIGAIGSRLASS